MFFQYAPPASAPSAWLEEEPLDISIVPRTAPPLINVMGEPQGRKPLNPLEQWIAQVVTATAEIIGGDRPLSQAVRWTSAQVYADLGRRTTLLGRVGRYAPGVGRVQRVRPRVTGVITSSAVDGVVDAAVVLRHGDRARGVATQFVRQGERWVCTVLDFGEEAAPRRPVVNELRALRDSA